MNAQEIIDLIRLTLRRLDIQYNEFLRQEFERIHDEEIKSIFGEYREDPQGADNAGRDHDEYKMVLFFKDHNVHIAFDGYYSSWTGPDWGNVEPYEVKMIEKTIVQKLWVAK